MSDTVTIRTPAGPASLRRTNRGTLAISVLPDGTLELAAPRDSSEADISAKIGRRLRWIIRQRATFAEMSRNRMPVSYASGATHRYLGCQYRLKVRRAEPAGVVSGGMIVGEKWRFEIPFSSV